jgi:hypothetical protein
MRVMYDDIYAANVPANGDLYAGYDDGHWPDADALQVRFPNKRVVRVTTNPHNIFGDVLDCETGDAKPTDVPVWLTKRRALGGDPSIYCSEFSATGIAAVEAACKAANVRFDRAHWWRANYNSHALLEVGESAHQWRDVGPYDSSVVADYWPGIDPAPVVNPPKPIPVPEEDMPLTQADANLVVSSLLTALDNVATELEKQDPVPGTAFVDEVARRVVALQAATKTVVHNP